MPDFQKFKKEKNKEFLVNLSISFLITICFLIPVDVIFFQPREASIAWGIYAKYFLIFHTGGWLWHLNFLRRWQKITNKANQGDATSVSLRE